MSPARTYVNFYSALAGSTGALAHPSCLWPETDPLWPLVVARQPLVANQPASSHQRARMRRATAGTAWRLSITRTPPASVMTDDSKRMRHILVRIKIGIWSAPRRRSAWRSKMPRVGSWRSNVPFTGTRRACARLRCGSARQKRSTLVCAALQCTSWISLQGGPSGDPKRVARQ